MSRDELARVASSLDGRGDAFDGRGRGRGRPDSGGELNGSDREGGGPLGSGGFVEFEPADAELPPTSSWKQVVKGLSLYRLQAQRRREPRTHAQDQMSVCRPGARSTGMGTSPEQT